MIKKQLKEPLQHLDQVEILRLLAESDKLMARIFEDAIHALLKNSVIQPRDLPDCAREVIEIRVKLRSFLEER